MTTEYTPQQVQQAKDFIWNNLAQHNKDLVLHIVCTNDILDKYSKELKEITIDRDLQVGYALR